MKQRRLAEWTDEINRHCNINIALINSFIHSLGSKGWRSGESARLPPMWPGFKSRLRRHMWVEFVVDSLCSERFISGYSGFPLSSKTSISKFQFDQESGRRRTTLWMCYLQIIIYFMLFYFICIHGKDTNCIYSFSCCFKLYSTKTFGFMI